ncbi:glucoamylase family protein [Novosphingopyxis iocasae]|uniref:glucoamylase family protein n=1 Tax=Novosphingopyxis iocasae TaxID=2762729 RepID=UPI0016517D27|nr:glucoamylase family protein [Novosphingopyxis iocasae]
MIDRRTLLGTGGVALAGLLGGCAPMAGIAASPAGKAGLIDDIQERTFRFFWETTDPKTGLAPDRWPTPSFASIAAVGFALTAYPIGVTRGWISRAQARERTLATLDSFANAPMGDAETGTSGYKGFFYHFLDMKTGHRFRNSELSTIDTTLLLGGVLFAAQWFDGNHPDEARIRALADRLYSAVEWTAFVPNDPVVTMGWRPESGFIPSDWNRYNESLLLYVLALGSPTHALPPETWDRWTSAFEANWTTENGPPRIDFPPLFGHQYSHVWVDFRGIQDRFMRAKGIDYFENSRRATLAQQLYAIENPEGWSGYGENVWGLTACDGPGHFKLVVNGREREFRGYSARGPFERDDGTIAPTAALGSIAFAPEIVEPTARAMVDRYGSALYQRYGFLDSFNPTLEGTNAPISKGQLVPGIGWVDNDYLGIDQGPIVCMIENRKSGLIWGTMRKSPAIRRGLMRAGFTGGWLA